MFGAVYKIMVKNNNMNRIDLLKTLTINPRKIMGFEHDLFKNGKKLRLQFLTQMKIGFLIMMISYQSLKIHHLLIRNYQAE
ncbi:MAG: hypothetical protein Ct9H300mP18_13160 [Candidatus Neomarinimicrobiota bacterium]|nr:MAG: hypothetical protein Ct9H300mP18_13160 [Candidatus Neomarinimicrobiota bacterium]